MTHCEGQPTQWKDEKRLLEARGETQLRYQTSTQGMGELMPVQRVPVRYQLCNEPPPWHDNEVPEALSGPGPLLLPPRSARWIQDAKIWLSGFRRLPRKSVLGSVAFDPIQKRGLQG